MAFEWPDADFVEGLVRNRYDRGVDVATLMHEFRRQGFERDLKKVKEELAKVKADKDKKEEEQKEKESLEKALSRICSRRDSCKDFGGRHGNYNNGEPTRRCFRCGDWKYPCECGDDHSTPRGRSRIRRRRRNHFSPQVNFIYLNEDDSDSEYANYYDWPPRDFYRRRWGGVLPDKRLKWLTEDLLLDGSDIIRPRRKRSRSYIDLRGVHFYS